MLLSLLAKAFDRSISNKANYQESRMKSSEEQRLGEAIIAGLERVRLHICQTGTATQWHLTKAANVMRKPSLLERVVPHLEGEPAEKYLASLPGWIEETKQQDSTCALLWDRRKTDHDSHHYQAERSRLVTLLLRYEFSLRSYEKLARQPSKPLAQAEAQPDGNGVHHHDVGGTRMIEEEFADLEQQINEDLKAVDKARAALVAAHEGLVMKHAAKSSAPIEESTNYARRGLVKAAENFDVRRGYRFSTYAQWWIKTAIKEKKVWAE